MTFLPIVERELRAASRRSGTYWLRFWAGLGVMGFAGWVLLVLGDQPPSQLAGTLFYGVTGVTLGVCLFAGPRFTAGSMTEEKREGTLGLLFLTDLKGYDVVLGKLVANSVHAFYALLAAVPVMALALLLGSFTFGHVIRVALALINALFFGLSIGMFASTLSRTTRAAAGTAMGLLLEIAIFIPPTGAWLESKTGVRGLGIILSLPSPVWTYLSAAGGFGTLGPGLYWTSLATVHGLAWLFLILACVYAPRCWQDQPALKTQPADNDRWQTWLQGRGKARAAHRRRLLERNPFYWRAARARFMPLAVWSVIALVAGGWVWAWLKYPNDWLNPVTYLLTALVLNTMLKLGVAAEATRPLTEERRDGTLELLLSTPLSVRDILRGQALALRRTFLGPAVLVLAADVAMMFAGNTSDLDEREAKMWFFFWIGLLVTFVADLWALYWVGMWRALCSRRPRHAFGEAIGRVLAVPALVFAVIVAAVAFFEIEVPQPVTWEALLGIWFVLGLITDLIFALRAREGLLEEFRERAAEQFAAPVPWWKAWWPNRAAR